MREHRPANDIAYRPDVGEIGPAQLVDRDKASLIECETDGLGVQSRGVRHPADGDDQLFERSRLGFTFAVAVLDGDLLAHGDGADLDPKLDGKSLLGEKLPRFLRHLLVGGAEKSG